MNYAKSVVKPVPFYSMVIFMVSVIFFSDCAGFAETLFAGLVKEQKKTVRKMDISGQINLNSTQN